MSIDYEESEEELFEPVSSERSRQSRSSHSTFVSFLNNNNKSEWSKIFRFSLFDFKTTSMIKLFYLSDCNPRRETKDFPSRFVLHVVDHRMTSLIWKDFLDEVQLKEKKNDEFLRIRGEKNETHWDNYSLKHEEWPSVHQDHHYDQNLLYEEVHREWTKR